MPQASALKQAFPAVQEDHANVAAQDSHLPREKKVEHAARQAASAPAATDATKTHVGESKAAAAAITVLLGVNTTAVGSVGVTKTHVGENTAAAAVTVVQTPATKTSPMTALPHAACDWMIEEAGQHATSAKTAEKVGVAAGVAPDKAVAGAPGLKTARVEGTARGGQETKEAAAAPPSIKACAERVEETASLSGSESDTVASDVPSSSLQNSVSADADGAEDNDNEDIVAQAAVLTQSKPTYTPKSGFETTPFDPYSHVCSGGGRKAPPSFGLLFLRLCSCSQRFCFLVKRI